MHERHRALPAPVAGSYQQAACVCLSRHHASPITIELSDNGVHTEAEVAWLAPDSRVCDAWANTVDAVEAGAYGCVIAGVEEMRGLVAVRRAETGTGADYYVGPSGAGVEDLEGCVRLEVSGVGSGDGRDVARRVIQKKQQARDGKSSLPAMAGVMGFAAKLLVVEDVPETP